MQIPFDIAVGLALIAYAAGILSVLPLVRRSRKRMPAEAYFQPDYSEKPELHVARRVA